MKLSIVIYFYSIYFLFNLSIQAQSMPLNKQLNLHDQTVELFEMNSGTSGLHKEYYCMPNNLRLSINESGQYEFLFMAYRKEGSDEDEAIMHWLLKIGFDESQILLIDSLLEVQVDSNARYVGQLTAESIGSMHFINRGGNPQLLEVIKSGLTSGGSVPVLSDTKSATAFKFSGTAAQMMIDCINNPKKLKGLYIEMKYQIKSILVFNKSDKEPHPKEISLILGLDKLIEKAKTCKECFILSN